MSYDSYEGASRLPVVPLYYSIPLLLVCISAFLILVFLFNVEVPQVMLQSVPTNVAYVNSCGVLNQDNAYYVLNQSINVAGNCITINGVNVTLDGESKYVLQATGIAVFVSAYGRNVTVKGLNITSAHAGIHLAGASNSTVVSNYISNSFNSIISNLGNGNSISNNIIDRPLSGGIGIGTIFFDGQSVSLKNNIVSNIPSSYSSLLLYSFNETSYGFAELTDNSFVYYNINSTFVTFVNLGNGKINFIESLMNVNGSNLNDDVRLGFNYAYVNSSNSGLNKSAIITFYGLPTNITNSTILRNGVLCPANICTNLTSLNAGTVVFNVTSWTNYSISNINSFINNPSNNANITTNNSLNSIISINEPDSGDLYTVLDFPVLFNVNLTLNGSVKFSLNGGFMNMTMNTTDNRLFTYSQSLLTVGNYTFTAYANLTNGTRLSASVNFRVVDIIPTMSIDEPDLNERYYLSAFPVTFVVTLNQNGSVKFSLNNGVMNTTMNTTDNVAFTYRQNLLTVGNYTFTAYANFTNGTRLSDSVDFRVVNNPSNNNPGGSSGGGNNNGGNSGSGNSSNSSGGSSYVSPVLPSNYSGFFNSNSGNIKSSSGSARNVVYWLIIVILFVAIIILVFLIIKFIKSNFIEENFNSTKLISHLR
ncbi:hypothetical protein J4423_00365 [Candidatus Pacearchaeota archaeon]|nr:hypothetical protein [Candidatus Pacearchaeota archaeon]